MKSAVIRFIPLVLAAVALWVFWRELHGMTLAQFTGAIAQWSHKRIALALAMVTSSYLLLALNEQIGLRWVGGRVKLLSGVAASFIAHALANNLGMGVVAGGALRISVFTRYGISLVQVAKLTAYGTSTFSLGVATLGGISLLTANENAFAALHLEPLVGHGLGVLLILVPVAYGLACTFAPDGMTMFGHEFRPPRLGVAITQILFGMADVALGGALFWLLIGPSAPPYVTFLTTYLLSLTTGLVSGVPGGVGVFESGMLLLLPASVNRGVLMAALLGYRLFYYLVPLGVALILLLTRRPRPSDMEQGAAD